MLLDNGTVSANALLEDAAHEAEIHGIAFPNTVLILRAMLRSERTVARLALENCDLVNDRFALDRVNRMSTDITASELSELASAQAKTLRHSYPGTEHLLLALCCLRSCHAAKLLEDVDGKDLRERVCMEVITILGNNWTRWRKVNASAF